MGNNSSNTVRSKASEVIYEEVHKHPVVVYTKNHCPYCMKAKDELNEYGILYVEKNLSEDASTASNVQGLIELTQCRTVPQIFVCGRFLGGYNEMHTRRADLVKMIEQCSKDGVTFKPGTDTVMPRT